MGSRRQSPADSKLTSSNDFIQVLGRFLSQMRAHSQMLDSKIGERVTFHPTGHPVLLGIVMRYNRKTVTVITEAGQQWNVAPGLLRRAASPEQTQSENAKVVPLKRE